MTLGSVQRKFGSTHSPFVSILPHLSLQASHFDFLSIPSLIPIRITRLTYQAWRGVWLTKLGWPLVLKRANIDTKWIKGGNSLFSNSYGTNSSLNMITYYIHTEELLLLEKNNENRNVEKPKGYIMTQNWTKSLEQVLK